MNTKPIFVELLIVGIQSMLWIGAAVVLVRGDWDLVHAVLNGGVPLSVVLLVVAYTLGVIFDRVWDWMLRPGDYDIRSKHGLSHPETGRRRALVWRGDEKYSRVLDYTRNRVRVVRATSCNFAVLFVVALVGTSLSRGDARELWALLAAIAAVISVLSYGAFRALTRSYYEQLIRLSNELGFVDDASDAGEVDAGMSN